MPAEYAAMLYETLKRAGEPYGLRDVGYRAIETCRLEKGYVYWSAEIGPDYDPLSAGLAWAVDLGKDFIGKSALLEVRKNGPQRLLCLFTVDGFAPLLGGETILKDGKVVGQTASCGFGHTLGQTIAFGWLPPASQKRRSSRSKRTVRATPQRRGHGRFTIRKICIYCRDLKARARDRQDERGL